MSEFQKGAATVIAVVMAIAGALYGLFIWGMSGFNGG